MFIVSSKMRVYLANPVPAKPLLRRSCLEDHMTRIRARAALRCFVCVCGWAVAYPRGVLRVLEHSPRP